MAIHIKLDISLSLSIYIYIYIKYVIVPHCTFVRIGRSRRRYGDLNMRWRRRRWARDRHVIDLFVAAVRLLLRGPNNNILKVVCCAILFWLDFFFCVCVFPLSLNCYSSSLFSRYIILCTLSPLSRPRPNKCVQRTTISAKHNTRTIVLAEVATPSLT
jgi:hypothetical protein